MEGLREEYQQAKDFLTQNFESYSSFKKQLSAIAKGNPPSFLSEAPPIEAKKYIENLQRAVMEYELMMAIVKDVERMYGLKITRNIID